MAALSQARRVAWVAGSATKLASSNKQMKRKLFLIIGLLAFLAGGVHAQDTNPIPAPAISGPGWDAIQFLGSGSNWLVAPYMIYSTGSKSAGGGIGVGYKVSDFVVPTLRLDYLEGGLYMPSASLQLQAPLKLLGKVTLIPFAFAGLATPISGKGKDNGSAVGIFGIGGAIRTDFIGSDKWWKPQDVIFDFEKWSGFSGSQYRLGFVWKL